MTIALLADLHGNWPATQAVAEDLQRRQLKTIYCLGDCVGKGPDSDKTLDWARANCQVMIGGNWDYGIGRQQFAADGYYWKLLGPERLAYLASLPPEHHFTFGGFNIRLVHGRPVMPELLFSHSGSEQLAPYLKGFDAFGFADTHRPGFRTLKGGYVFNCGSVGNSMGVPRAHYLLLTQQPSGIDFTIVSLPYDNALAARIAEETPDLPRGEAYIKEVTTGIYSR